MGHQVAYLAAVGGKHRGNKSNFGLTSLANIRRLLIAAAVLFGASAATSPVHAQAGGPFAGMAGNWSGGGTVTLDDGSRERLRCRASYGVAGAQMTMTLTCASDAYKFQLSANVVDQGGAVSGNWTETSRNISGSAAGPWRRRQLRRGRQHRRLQRQHFVAHHRQQAVDQYARRQPVPGCRDLAVALTL